MHQRANGTDDLNKHFSNANASPHAKMLASRLCDHMGLDGAIRISTENQWHGILSILEDIKSQQR
ncbi:hypothetical protein [Kordiimonas sp. SCSIO 12610]|uniref:hypothetical protein n=1 Tax=Kordiimonas sp. SCSIO 12610 TaxID=2829597 RepID=UPI00210BDA04|nr:hypothetical protein [Kordiimonas sp. SCSIO 12610]UTW55897.1 hypothetical protein KFF44_03105 [Kordiimonas sp. SCSIO 12610]